MRAIITKMNTVIGLMELVAEWHELEVGQLTNLILALSKHSL